MMDADIKFYPLFEVDALEEKWLSLESRSHAPVFLTWGWIGQWLKLVSGVLDIHVLEIRKEQRLIGLAIFSKEMIKRRYFVRSTVLVMNTTFKPRYNVVIEHNGMLSESGSETVVWEAFLRFFSKKHPGDEVLIPFSSKFPSAARLPAMLAVKELETRNSYAVDLDALRKKNMSFMDYLSRNTRGQVRSAMRQFQKLGRLVVSEPDSISEAFAYFDGLKELHQKYWQRKGKNGVFYNPDWERFHRGLIDACYEKGQIKLFQVAAGQYVIGYIYSLVRDGVVSMIQSGFDYGLIKKGKPGYVSHCLAIERCANSGLLRYDFLAGDGQYKRSLSNLYEAQVDIAIQKRRVRFLIEDAAVKLSRSPVIGRSLAVFLKNT